MSPGSPPCCSDESVICSRKSHRCHVLPTAPDSERAAHCQKAKQLPQIIIINNKSCSLVKTLKSRRRWIYSRSDALARPSGLVPNRTAVPTERRWFRAWERWERQGGTRESENKARGGLRPLLPMSKPHGAVPCERTVNQAGQGPRLLGKRQAEGETDAEQPGADLSLGNQEGARPGLAFSFPKQRHVVAKPDGRARPLSGTWSLRFSHFMNELVSNLFEVTVVVRTGRRTFSDFSFTVSSVLKLSSAE